MKTIENTTIDFTYDDKGDMVYFMVNLEQLYGIKTSFPGLRSKIRKAFEESRKVTPIDTGLMRSSYSIQYVADNRVLLFFDPHKIIGKNRKGRIVKEYYPMYLADKAKTFSWLDIVARRFFTVLLQGIRELNKQIEKDNKKSKDKRQTVSLVAFLSFYKLFKDNLRNKIKTGRTGKDEK